MKLEKVATVTRLKEVPESCTGLEYLTMRCRVPHRYIDDIFCCEHLFFLLRIVEK